MKKESEIKQLSELGSKLLVLQCLEAMVDCHQLLTEASLYFP